MIITDNCNGTIAGQVREPQRKALDEENSGIWAGSTFARFDHEGVQIGQPKDTDDKIVVGYTHDGLPFQIVVDGFFSCDKGNVFRYIDEFVTPLMDDYAKDLSNPENRPETITQQLIEQIRQRRPMGQGNEFTMSIAMTYEREGQLQCSGFGIGDTGIAVKRAHTGDIVQLATNNEITQEGGAIFAGKYKEGFDNASNNVSLEDICQHNKLFTTFINPGDEIVGYTYVHDEMEEVSEEFQVDTDKTVSKKKLEIKQLEDQNLFDYLLTENARIQQRKLEGDNAGQQWGDDTTIGQIIVPQPELRAHIQKQPLVTLQGTINTIQNNALNQKAQAVYNRTKALFDNGENIFDVMEHVQLTNQLLLSQPGEDREQLSAQYKQAAKRAQGKPSLGWRLLGGAMMVLGVAAAVVGGLVCAGTLGLGTPAGVALIGGGIGLFALGSGFFYHGRQKGLSKDMNELAKSMEPSEHQPLL